MKFTKNLCGSKLEILIPLEWEFSDSVNKCFKFWELFENKYSRFIEWNHLSELNKKWGWEISSDLIGILKLCQEVSKKSDGYFDITVCSRLENLWYWIKTEEIQENIWYKNIIIDNNSLYLKNWINIDIWAIWKWYLVDVFYNILDKNIDNFTINFGWDIRVKWTKNISLEDPMNLWKSLWTVELTNSSIASSSWNRRIFWESHHLINPKTKESQNDKIWVYVQHKLASFADIFSTALFVTPLDKSLEILASTPGLEALIISKNRKIYKSKWFQYTIK